MHPKAPPDPNAPPAPPVVPSLTSHRIPDRIAAIQLLGEGGGEADLDLLVDLATRDPSPSVRLASAGAAADLLHRHLRPSRRAGVSEARREALLRRIRGLDPGANPGLLQALACLGRPDALELLGRALRDPRADVRMGALIGLERLAASAASNGDRVIAELVLSLVRESSARPEMAAEAARIACQLGGLGGLEEIEELAARLHPRQATRTLEFLAILRALAEPEASLGLWIDTGFDAGGGGGKPEEPRRWLLIVPGYAWTGTEEGGSWQPLPQDVPPRRLRVRFQGEANTDLLQVGERTCQRAED